VPLFEARDVSASATLSGASGPLEVRVLDSTSPDVGAYMPRPSAFLIPVQPLQPLTRYEADVKWSASGLQLFDQRFSFTTGTDPGSAAAPAKKHHRAGCNRYAKFAKALRDRAARTHRRGVRLGRRAGASRSERRKGARLLARSARLRHRARNFDRQARQCAAKLT
jgi:hypothetical protein